MNKGTIKTMLILVAVLTAACFGFALREFLSYRTAEKEFDKYCDEYIEIYDSNCEIYSQLKEAGVKIDETKLNEEY